ncbi:phosphate ABC transporter permease PstA [Georgenia halophila]|uniref:Phosphate transport system permease protein PstA n=1 Tax=Georgenia halophila TaxID=620889 RepID=A0ABP8KZJ2_9MICO
MTATTSTKRPPLATAGRLPAYAPWAMLVGALALAYLALAVLSEPTPVAVAVLGGALFVAGSWLVSRIVEGARRSTDRLATSLVTAAFLVAVVPLLALIWLVVSRGVPMMSWEFLTSDMTGIYGDLRGGGILHAIIGTAWVTGLASLFSIPLGIFTAIYLVEYGQGRLKRAITLLVDVMTGIPSIVAGLFAFVLFTSFDPQYRSAFMGSVALAVLMTPVVVRSCEEMLRLVPNELREASYALGVPKWLTIVKVVLRTAVAGITTGVMIAIARVIGETAPLLLTVGFITTINENPFEGRMATLPVYVYRSFAQGGINMERAWAAALTLIAIVMLLNIVARLVGRYFAPKGMS